MPSGKTIALQEEITSEAAVDCPSEDGATPQRRAPFVRYLFWFLFPPFLLYCGAFALVRSRSFEHWNRSQWGPMLDYAFETGPQNADVLIFGDSSAFIGVDPRIVNAQLGLKTLVLPNTIGSLPVTGDLALRRYLAANAPPKLLVLYFSPWNLDYLHARNVLLFEGEEMLLRHGTWREIAAFTRGHPLEILVFPLRLYTTFGPRMIRALLERQDRERATADALGHVDDADPFPPLSDSCSIPTQNLRAGSEASVEALARRYTTSTTQVWVYLAPIPGCRNASQLLTRSFAPLDTAPVSELPPGDFLGDPNFAHIRPPFVPASSNLFAEALGKRLGIAVVRDASAVSPVDLRAR